MEKVALECYGSDAGKWLAKVVKEICHQHAMLHYINMSIHINIYVHTATNTVPLAMNDDCLQVNSSTLFLSEKYC